MPESAAANAVTDAQWRALNALAELALAYFDRMGAGDWTRAGIVLSVFADTYNAHRADAAEIAQQTSGNPTEAVSLLPGNIQGHFDGITRTALQAVLVLASTQLRTSPLQQRWVAALEAMPQVAISLNGWWLGSAAALAEQVFNQASFSLSTQIAQAEVAGLGSLGDTITQYIATGHAALNAAVTPTPIPGVNHAPAPTPPSTPMSEITAPTPVPATTTLPGTTVYGANPAFVMPTWGWWAIGIGGVAAAGVVTWGILEQGWFGIRKPAPAPRGRRRKRRR